jgi:hypothetical protein
VQFLDRQLRNGAPDAAASNHQFVKSVADYLKAANLQQPAPQTLNRTVSGAQLGPATGVLGSQFFPTDLLNWAPRYLQRHRHSGANSIC